MRNGRERETHAAGCNVNSKPADSKGDYPCTCGFESRSSSKRREVPYEYVKSNYGVNPVIGQRVTMGEKSGVIVAKRSYDHYVHVKFDGRNFDVRVHPMELDYGAGGEPKAEGVENERFTDERER